MKITNVRTVGFRKFEKDFETKLYEITNITGGNTKGKTNILYAIVWAFLGTNLNGDDKVWLGNKNSDNCAVEVKFIDNNNKKHTLLRYKNKINNKENFIMLDDKKVDDKVLTSFYGDKKLFLSIINPNYFISRPPREQKQLIDKYLPNIDISDVYDKLNDLDKLYLEVVPDNITNYLSKINENKKLCEKRIEHIQGKIDYAKTFVNTEIADKKVFEKAEELSLARQELSYLSSEGKKENLKIQKENVDNLKSAITKYTNQISELEEQMKTGKELYVLTTNKEESCCPTCRQAISGKSKLTTLKNIKEDLLNKFNKRNKLNTELIKLKGDLSIQNCILKALQNAEDGKNLDRIEEIKIHIEKLEQEERETINYNESILNQIKIRDGAKQDIEIFENKLKEQRDLIDRLKIVKKVAEKLLINYIEEKMKTASVHLKNVKIKYYSVLKESGEIKEDFIITYNNNEFKNLSKSETMATSIELRNMFNKISGVNIPLFIDDSESCADYNFTEEYSTDTQLLIARVEKGKELEITEYCLDEEKCLQVA